MRFTLDCVTAAMLPTVIVTIATTSNSSRQIRRSWSAGLRRRMRISIAKDAAFEPTERNAVTGVGAPSYTSGAHMWNGTAAILKPTPATTRMTASTRRGSFSCPAKAVAITLRFVVPESPYISDMPVQEDAERERAEQEVLDRRFRSTAGSA